MSIEGDDPLPQRMTFSSRKAAEEPVEPFWVDEVYPGQAGAPTKFGVLASRLVAERRSAFQTIKVYETSPSGRILTLDDCYMTETRFEHFYHEMLVHPALCAAFSVERVLIIGGGDGGTAREVLRHPEVRYVTLCEIDEGVTVVAREHLREMNVPWGDPRMHVMHEDGVALMSTAVFPTMPKYDVIIVDGADPEGPAKALFSEEFYRNCKRHLKPWSGVLVTQSLSPLVQRGHMLEAARNMRAAFRHVNPYFGPMPIYPGGTWSYLLANEGASMRAYHPKVQRLAAIEPHCRHYNGDIHRAAFAVPADLKREFDAIL